jgi:lysophospholipase L1-like esterase
VDGVSTVIPNVNGTSIKLPAGLKKGKHTVELQKRSEGFYGSITIGKVTTDGKLEADKIPNRKIQFIGDSITVGYGIGGVFPCSNTAVLEDNPKTYAALAAKSLKADYDVIAWSGIGLVRNTAYGSTPGDPTMINRYTQYGANDPENSYTFPKSDNPNAIVIALGTNDFSNNNNREPLNGTEFASATVSFIRSIQKHYPKAQFFLLQSPMISDGYPAGENQWTTQKNAFESAITQLGSSKVHFIGWAPQGSEVTCDYHPTAATNAAQAPVVASAIAKVLGW